MFFGISHIRIPTRNLVNAEAFWAKLIGFNEIKRGEGFIDLDSGSVTLRLVEMSEVNRPVTLRLSVPDVDIAFHTLISAGGTALYETQRTPALELEAHVADPDGNSVIVWRELTEDEYGFVPELPKQSDWHLESEQLLNALLKYVPALFRGMARKKVTKIIEELAAMNHSAVTREHVIRGYILSSAKIKRHRLIEPLKLCGIDPAHYQEEFSD